MASLAATRHLGEFWLADVPERRLTGVLDLSPGRSTVTTSGQLSPWLGETEVPMTIHGELSYGSSRKITILDAVTRSRRIDGFFDPRAPEGMSSGMQEFSGTWVIQGCHVKADDGIEYASIRFTHLDAWLDSDGLTDRTDDDADALLLEYRKPESKSAPIPGGRARISTHFQPPILPLAIREINMAHRAWLSFSNLEAKSLDHLLGSAILPALALITVMVGRKCELTELNVQFRQQECSAIVSHPAVKPDATEERIDPGFEFISLPHIKIDYLANWIAASGKFSPIYNIVYSSFGKADSQGLESRVLELAACVEGFDRRKYNDEPVFDRRSANRARRLAVDAVKDGLDVDLASRVRGTLAHFEKSTFSERLYRLIRMTEGAMPGLAGNEKEWVRRVKNARNGYAHMLDGVGDEWEVSYALLESLRWMLGCAMLLEAGIPVQTINERAARQMDYQRFKVTASSLAPSIYA